MKELRKESKATESAQEQANLDKTIRRARQIASAVLNLEAKTQDKEAYDDAEEDAFSKEDRQNDKLE